VVKKKNHIFIIDYPLIDLEPRKIAKESLYFPKEEVVEKDFMSLGKDQEVHD